MQTTAMPASAATRRHRPKTLTVFAASFAAGVVLAYGVNRVVDVHVVQVEPQVESEAIFVALRSMPQGAPVTVWDVALKDWPKAMLPTTALKADAALDGMVLRHPIREGQPLLSVQLVRDVVAANGVAIAAAPTAVTVPAAGPAGTATSAPAPAATAVRTVAEQFVPAAPAEPAAVAPREAVTAPAVPPSAPTAAEPVPAVAVAVPRSTDVDEPAVDPVDARPTPVAAAEPAPEPFPVPEPLPAPFVPVAADAPLAAPVPALPSTDIERSLAAFGNAHRPQAPRSESVLDRTTEAEPPTAAQSAPKHHLVIPERIALAVDASFAQQPRKIETDERTPTAEPPAREPQRAVTGNVTGNRTGNRTGAHRQPTAPPSTRKPAARPQAEPANRGFNAWMPKFLGENRQR